MGKIENLDFKKWIESEEGKKCNNFSTIKGQPYLQNRLWWAFMAGVEFGKNEEFKATNHDLGELLAILHGDGGHYQEKHGTLKAIIDAKELINKEWIRPPEDNDQK